VRASVLAGYNPERSARAERDRRAAMPPAKKLVRKVPQAVAKARAGGRNGGKRLHEPLKVGQRFGARVVTGHAPGYYGRRSDERVTWRCDCGQTGESYAFNLRGRDPGCTHRGLW